MTITSKTYKYLLFIVDGFSKFVWLYTKTTSIKEVLDKLTAIQQIFGNPRCIITERYGVHLFRFQQLLYCRRYRTGRSNHWRATH